MKCVCLFADGQQNRERVIQMADSGVAQGSEGRSFARGLHQLPVRPVTQNGKHTSCAEANLANASGENKQHFLPCVSTSFNFVALIYRHLYIQPVDPLPVSQA